MTAKTCLECGATFSVAPGSGKQQFCSKPCWRKNWYRRNAEKERTRVADYTSRNQDRVRTRRQSHSALHKERLNQISREYFLANRQDRLEKQRLYKKLHRPQMRVLEHRRRALLAQAEGSFTKEEWESLCASYGHRCYDCGQVIKLTVGHAVPLSRGGSNYIDNIIPQCISCNCSQYTKIHPRVTKERYEKQR